MTAGKRGGFVAAFRGGMVRDRTGESMPIVPVARGSFDAKTSSEFEYSNRDCAYSSCDFRNREFVEGRRAARPQPTRREFAGQPATKPRRRFAVCEDRERNDDHGIGQARAASGTPNSGSQRSAVAARRQYRCPRAVEARTEHGAVHGVHLKRRKRWPMFSSTSATTRWCGCAHGVSFSAPVRQFRS
jgi:hypothetical protein